MGLNFHFPRWDTEKDISAQGKTALVLSAGGMFAAYQAGAWKALASRLRADIVVGASAGAINAWVIAAGVSPDELISLWLDPTCRSLVAYRPFQPPWRGIVDCRPIDAFLRELCERYRPRIEIGIVATQIPRLRMRLFQNDEIDWRSMAASAAIPFVFRPVRIGGKLYADGGLLEALPIWAAARMGATRIVAINVLAYPPSRLAGWAVRAFRALAPRPPASPSGLQLSVIQPGGPLGRMRDALFWRRDAVERWILLGERQAAQHFYLSPRDGGVYASPPNDGIQ
ncbi:MAG TPA: patatin-like phospholipase family protein [Bryobacteraceae bacterium]|nr:patatin-like phospholipase family protein [Bryobacteraceae bacterium]